MRCYYCKQTFDFDDLRPYGPQQSMVCFDCATSSPEREEATAQAFGEQLAACGPVAVLDGTGVGPYPAQHAGLTDVEIGLEIHVEIAITEDERQVLLHALTGSVRGAGAHRNYFLAGTGHHDERHLEHLCALGLMTRGRKINGGRSQYYHCTEAGARAVGLRLPTAERRH